MNTLEALSKPSYTPLEDGFYEAELTGFNTTDNEKGGYLTLNLVINSRPLAVNIFPKQLDFTISNLQRIVRQDGLTGIEVLSVLRDTTLRIPVTIAHEEGYRNVYFYHRTAKVHQQDTTVAEAAEDCPM